MLCATKRMQKENLKEKGIKTMETKGIYKKINNIMKKVEFVTKDGKLGFGNNQFSVVTHDKVLSVVRQHFVDDGVIVIPHQVEKAVCVPGTTKNGGAKIRVEALYDVTFIDVDDGSSIVIRSEAHAEDNSDKGANKALTYAVKNALLKILMLQTGDDINQEVANKINAKQITMLKGLIESTETDLTDFLNYYGATSYEDFAQSYFAGAIDTLQKKQKKAKS